MKRKVYPSHKQQQQQHQQHYRFFRNDMHQRGIGNNTTTSTSMDDSTTTIIPSSDEDNPNITESSSTANSNNSTLVPQLQILPETTAYWSREPYAWSSTSAIQRVSPSVPLKVVSNVSTEDNDESTSSTLYTKPYYSSDPSLPPPLLTSSKCSKAFYDVFRNTYYSEIGNIDIEQPNFLLSIIVESCSHPSGLNALFAQPYMYSGPGLGNIDICPLQTCIAGNGNPNNNDPNTNDPPHQQQQHHSSNSITFASICIVPECTAYDLGSEDFIAAIARQYDYAMQPNTPIETIDLGREYVLLLRRMAEINKFLKTGWTCGDFVVPFDMFPFGLPYVILCCIFVLLSGIGTIRCQCRHRTRTHNTASTTTTTTAIVQPPPPLDHESCALLVESSTNGISYYNGHLHNGDHCNGDSTKSVLTKVRPTTTECSCESSDSIWLAFNVGKHLRHLTQPSSHTTERTACLDGLRVGSTLWIILGHVLAIQSSSGAGYSNPSNFLPPTGLTTTFIGQLLFSSRFAVDTFLIISGYLVVHGLCRLQHDFLPSGVPSWYKNVVVRYITTIPVLILTRVGRILPLYAMSLGFFTQIAPHMGNGPFWHQWINLLQPCHDYIWTNFLFINNIIPLQTPTTSTCFYHSWYIAVDMQLFILAPFLVFWYQYSKRQGQVATCLLLLASVVVTAHWSYSRSWSINTFDGKLVNRYDVEAYANPITRAQAYLAGMYVAFIISNMNDRPRSSDHKRMPYCWIHRAIMAATITVMFVVSFATVTGAYARRPCTYDEDPFSNICGSTWSPTKTFLYTAFGRSAWIIGISTMLYLCIGRGQWNDGDGNLVACILSWPCWRPLSHLSFGAYLIHPIVVFVWQLGDREKQVFRLITFGMDYISVCVVSFVAALFASVLVECPCALLLKKLLQQGPENLKLSNDVLAITVDGKYIEDANDCSSTDSAPFSISPPTPAYENYGSLIPPSSAVNSKPIDKSYTSVEIR